MSNTGYARVSTDDQDPAAQIDALRAAGCDPIFVEHASGATMQRPEWQACNRGLGRGDTLTIVRIDRLGRSLADLMSTLDDLAARGVHFRSLEERIDTSTALGRMFYQLAGAFAEYERTLIRERTCAGIDAARAPGRAGGPAAGTHERPARFRAPAACAGRGCGHNRPSARRVPIDD